MTDFEQLDGLGRILWAKNALSRGLSIHGTLGNLTARSTDTAQMSALEARAQAALVQAAVERIDGNAGLIAQIFIAPHDVGDASIVTIIGACKARTGVHNEPLIRWALLKWAGHREYRNKTFRDIRYECKCDMNAVTEANRLVPAYLDGQLSYAAERVR
jgi:hypothetical protein